MSLDYFMDEGERVLDMGGFNYSLTTFEGYEETVTLKRPDKTTHSGDF